MRGKYINELRKQLSGGWSAYVLLSVMANGKKMYYSRKWLSSPRHSASCREKRMKTDKILLKCKLEIFG